MIDVDDDLFDECVWIKVNLGFGSLKCIEYMCDMVCKVVFLLSVLVNFFIKDFNVWVNLVDGWISLQVWDKGVKLFDILMLVGWKCYGGFDFFVIQDLIVFLLVFLLVDDD